MEQSLKLRQSLKRFQQNVPEDNDPSISTADIFIDTDDDVEHVIDSSCIEDSTISSSPFAMLEARSKPKSILESPFQNEDHSRSRCEDDGSTTLTAVSTKCSGSDSNNNNQKISPQKISLRASESANGSCSLKLSDNEVTNQNRKDQLRIGMSCYGEIHYQNSSFYDRISPLSSTPKPPTEDKMLGNFASPFPPQRGRKNKKQMYLTDDVKRKDTIIDDFKTKENADNEGYGWCCGLRRMMVAAFVASISLLGAIALLSLTLHNIRRSPASTMTYQDTIAPTTARTESPTPSPSSKITRSPTSGPAVSPTTRTNLPTSGPTLRPSGASVNSIYLRDIVLNFSPVSKEDLNDPISVQSQALEWLIEDENVSNYTEDKITQRWALATFFLSIVDLEQPRRLGGKRKLAGLPNFKGRDDSNYNNWMSYTDECSWFSSGSANTCDGSGRITRIFLENLDLAGSLASELSLLSNLGKLYLGENKLIGSIPTELGLLTKLERVRLTHNSLQGTIPSELGRLSKLAIIGLGRNELSGTLPPELSQLERISTLGLEGNNLIGTIPSELSGMNNLKFLSLSSNDLSGTIPSELGLCSSLMSLVLHKNHLVGEVPQEICDIRRGKRRGFDDLVVDCDEVECDCCTRCE